jgi:cardiolipin synthase
MKKKPAGKISGARRNNSSNEYTWWQIGLFCIGSLSFVAILVVLFLPIGKGPSNFDYSGPVPPVSSPKFAAMIAETMNAPLKQAGSIEILNNGDAFLKSFLADIDAAKSSIDVMVYIWTDGKMSDQVLEHLNQKLKQGVQVRIIIDSYGSSSNTPDKQFKASRGLGAKITTFHSLTIAPWDFLKNQIRNHRRAIIIDGNIGYTGGMTVSDPWLGDARGPKEYRDMMFRATGPLAHDLQGVFGELWTSMTGEILAGDAIYPEAAASPEKRGLTYVPLARVPSPDSLALQKLVLLSLKGAGQKIYVTTPYFLPDASLREALINKAKDGLDVRVLVPNSLNDSQSVRYASQDSYQELLSGGVKIYEYQPAFIHTKSIIVDGTWSVVGSANMDNRSRKLNQEVVLGLSDKGFGAAMESTFLGDLAHAEEIRPAEWTKRGVWQRIREKFDRNLVEQY